jgi:hypothetical protein
MKSNWHITVLPLIVGLLSVLVYNYSYNTTLLSDSAASAIQLLTNLTRKSTSSTTNSDTVPTQAATSTATSDILPEAPSEFLFANEMSVSRTIQKAFLAVEQAEGAGARVRRSIGTPQLRNFSPFLMLDHFSIKPGAGFPDQYVSFA